VAVCFFEDRRHPSNQQDAKQLHYCSFHPLSLGAGLLQAKMHGKAHHIVPSHTAMPVQIDRMPPKPAIQPI
jgi:hypothetical protein